MFTKRLFIFYFCSKGGAGRRVVRECWDSRRSWWPHAYHFSVHQVTSLIKLHQVAKQKAILAAVLLGSCELIAPFLIGWLVGSVSTRPHQNAFWCNNSWLGFLKILNYVPNERDFFFFLQKMSPHLSQLNVAMAHRNYFRQNNLWILKLATYTEIEDHYSRCKLATF